MPFPCLHPSTHFPLLLIKFPLSKGPYNSIPSILANLSGLRTYHVPLHSLSSSHTGCLSSNAPNLSPTQGLCACSPVLLEPDALMILPPDASHLQHSAHRPLPRGCLPRPVSSLLSHCYWANCPSHSTFHCPFSVSSQLLELTRVPLLIYGLTYLFTVSSPECKHNGCRAFVKGSPVVGFGTHSVGVKAGFQKQ